MNCLECEFVDREKYLGEYFCPAIGGVALPPEKECKIYEKVKEVGLEKYWSAYRKEVAYWLKGGESGIPPWHGHHGQWYKPKELQSSCQTRRENR